MRPPASLAVTTLLALALLPAVSTAQNAPTQPPPSPSTLRIAVISDLNERYGDQFYRPEVHAAVARLVAMSPDLVLVAGDMVAGQRGGLDYAGMWSAFEEAVLAPLEGIPLAVAPGNHDASDGERYVDERAIYRETWLGYPSPARFEAVRLLDGGDYPLRYTFTMGPVLFIALDATERNALRDGDQLDWLESQLQAADPEETPIRILFGHVPFYPFARDREGSYLLRDDEIRRRVERLWVEYGVDLVISGHHHAYYPGRHPTLPVRMLAMGCLGGGPRVLLGQDREIEDPDDPTERSFAVIEIVGSEIRAIEAYRGPGFGMDDRIDRAELPEGVGEGDLRVVRDDL